MFFLSICLGDILSLSWHPHTCVSLFPSHDRKNNVISREWRLISGFLLVCGRYEMVKAMTWNHQIPKAQLCIKGAGSLAQCSQQSPDQSRYFFHGWHCPSILRPQSNDLRLCRSWLPLRCIGVAGEQMCSMVDSFGFLYTGRNWNCQIMYILIPI